MTDKYNERSFVRNINKVAEHLETLKGLDGVLTEEALKILRKANDAGFRDIIEDFAKGATEVGTRKLDIDLRLNTRKELRHVSYTHVHVMAFNPITEQVDKVPYTFSAPVSTTNDVFLEILAAFQAVMPDFLDPLTGTQYLNGIAIDLVEGDRASDQIIRVTDTGESKTSTLIGFCLTVADSVPVENYIEEFFTVVWADTSSSLATAIMNIASLNSAMYMAERFSEQARLSAIESANSAAESEASAVESEISHQKALVQANRAEAEADRSFDEAERAVVEADRAFTEAERSTEQADRALSEADRSEIEATASAASAAESLRQANLAKASENESTRQAGLSEASKEESTRQAGLSQASAVASEASKVESARQAGLSEASKTESARQAGLSETFAQESERQASLAGASATYTEGLLATKADEASLGTAAKKNVGVAAGNVFEIGTTGMSADMQEFLSLETKADIILWLGM